jgi:hypothetical protein
MSNFPALAHIRIKHDTPELNGVETHLKGLLAPHSGSLGAGQRIGIAVGSRGIHGIKEMVSLVVSFIKECGAEPVVLTAMGSHGGATAAGQTEVLASYGITEAGVGAPILASMKTKMLGATPEGYSVYFDAAALELDGIILLNRVKPHTDFHARLESGLIKQAVIGLGNHAGAQYVHTFGLRGLTEIIPMIGRVILEKAPILFGLAVLENAKDTTAEIHLLTPGVMEEREAELNKRAATLMPSLPVKDLDVLVVESMGKNLSGVGIDPNITGRRFIRQDPEGDADVMRRIACLDLTEESHGNALGVGLADIITKRLYDKIDLATTYANVITSGFVERGFVPIVMDDDRQCISTAIQTCGRRVRGDEVRLVQIANTLELEEMFVAKPLIGEMPAGLDWELIEEFEYRFTPGGELLSLVANNG